MNDDCNRKVLKILICGGLNANQSPHHPPQKEAVTLDHAWKGLKGSLRVAL